MASLLPPGFDPFTTPNGVPPPGVTPNLIDPPSRAWVARITVYLTLPPMVFSLVLRLVARLKTRQLGVDDYLCFAAATITIAFCGVLLAAYVDDVHGRHQWDIPVSAVTHDYLMKLVTVLVTYFVAAMLTKISLCTLYLRLFKPSKAAKWLIWLGQALIGIFYTITFLTTLIYCVPRTGDGGWGSRKSLDRCARPQVQIAAAAGVVGTILDFYILTIPLGIVFSLKLHLTKKVGIAAIFLTGLLACAFSTYGAYLRFVLLVSAPQDIGWPSATALGLSAVELNIGLICCCIPVTTVLFRSLSRKFQNFKKHIKEYIPSPTRSKTITNTSTSTSLDDEVLGKPRTHNGLPEIPSGRFTGLRSFFQKNFPSQSENTVTFETQTSNYGESSPGNHLVYGMYSALDWFSPHREQSDNTYIVAYP
ncbi:hypothetical protein O1611_g6515 [Lasiodiplodia mahajangana]|uniref:Uncharacterized protein n=1 Tax=Lasiodiplodia mahajangana TaxID=1108764 RepID=A0ACC2JI33_9PEZI|nr:hypothetical protein O1611_g6515 [Lasiodiplodia mahajangana]